MGEECKDCKKWEEEMYWSHFQTVQFCLILSRKSDKQMAIPKKFANNLREKLSGKVALKGPSGGFWEVELLTDGDKLLLKHGWKEFVDDHSLEDNDILIFKYKGNSRFDVSMFDKESLCEKESSYFIRKCVHKENTSGAKRRRNLEEIIESTDESSDSPDTSTPPSRTRNAAARTPASRRQAATARVTSKGRRGTRNHRNRGSGILYPLQRRSRRRPVTEEEIERAQHMAIAAASSDSFVVIMRASHVYKGFFMSIPAEWAGKHIPRRTHEVELRIGDKRWQAKYLFRGYGGGLCGGWKDFVVDNCLEEHDVCVFDLVREMDGAYTLEVKIYRVVNEVVPASFVTRPDAPEPSLRDIGAANLLRYMNSGGEDINDKSGDKFDE